MPCELDPDLIQTNIVLFRRFPRVRGRRNRRRNCAARGVLINSGTTQSCAWSPTTGSNAPTSISPCAQPIEANRRRPGARPHVRRCRRPESRAGCRSARGTAGRVHTDPRAVHRGASVRAAAAASQGGTCTGGERFRWPRAGSPRPTSRRAAGAQASSGRGTRPAERQRRRSPAHLRQRQGARERHVLHLRLRSAMYSVQTLPCTPSTWAAWAASMAGGNRFEIA